ncbi:ras guanine nucleotide exchange factor domain-containing protein [Fomitopsis serialis]|uniref:ras guanine nucleotide exchange factor domain-containing protein n=1 Tax=Fomitopsis serialis TaxID=139415 RepID=UPI002008AEEB|nr:ras guanine nucleotide exchange factor domain-containing protein [Neoantrodia serialis]KAH9936172.1 ras guanine nucleotide exchange factor domain-containing protein [Neoantrodia serialis]
MPAAGLRIDTSIAVAGPSSSRLALSTPASARSSRLRSASSASTSSSISGAAVQAEAGPSNFPQAAYAAPRISWSFEQSLTYEDDNGEYVLAMHDYQPEGHDINCLTFQARQIIRVLNRDPSGWWDGEVEGRRGWFPSNYVTCEVGLLTEEELPDMTKAARENRVAHFQPSTAFIISCVRAILSDVGCFQRDAPILKRHGILAQERKRILSDLASLVTQARKASEEDMGDDLRELEVEAMVRLGGNLFAHVRGLLALLAQCGIRLPAHGGLPPGSTLGTQTQSSEDTAVSDDGGAGHEWGGYEKSTNGIVHRPSSKQVVPSTATPMRAKSMGDLKAQRPRPSDGDVAQMPTDGHYKVFGGSLRQSSTPRPNRYTAGVMVRHEAGNSVSSNSSSSSFSSIDSIATPATPAFPSGPSTTPEVMEALRYTHDQYLSTIAAFIGHTHWHSRSTHASSTGHMYGLIREVVDMVCKLLTIVDAVLKHPDLPAAKSAGLKTAKEALYTITGKLVDSVRSLTLPAPEGMSEEEEKSLILHCATDALKVGADCVAAVKKCLRRATESGPSLSTSQRSMSPTSVPLASSRNTWPPHESPQQVLQLPRVAPMYVTSEADGDDQDLTIQARTLSSPEVTLRIERQSVASPTEASLPNPWQPPEPSSLSPTFPSSNKPLPPLRIPSRDVSPDFPSPVSLTHTEDDRTTWEGSDRRPYSPASFDEQVLRGGLPAGPEPMRRTLVAWTLSHDHAEDDVAYNSDGQLVGATLSALVERMTPHDSVPEQAFSSVFFLTFRLFSTPMDLVGAIVDRYNIKPPAGLNADEVQTWTQRKGFPIRLRVSNFVKIWLETHWRPAADNVALSTLLDFTRDCLTEISSTDEAGSAVKADRAREALVSLNPPSVPLSEVPRPVMTKNLLNALRQKSFTSIAITDFDPLELARQMTTMESQLYCAIKPEEVLETGKEGATSPINVKAKRTSLVKFFIKLADRCNSLSNFSTLRAILAALDSSTISRLHQTWQGLSQKYKMQLESLRKLSDHARNYHEYRSRLRNTAPPAIPFLGLYLTDVTFCREGNPSFRPSPKSPDKKLLNFNKYHKLARIVQDMQRFQTPYNLKQIPEVQEYLRDAFERSARQGDLQDSTGAVSWLSPSIPPTLLPRATSDSCSTGLVRSHTSLHRRLPLHYDLLLTGLPPLLS